VPHEGVPDTGHWLAARRRVNPAHLEPVTHQVNVLRSQAPERTREYLQAAITSCPKGHPYDEANTQWRTTKTGYPSRRCAECNRVRTREWKAARKKS
jgi:hypothetical protein